MRHLFKESVFLALLMIVIITLSMLAGILGATQISETIASSGSISHSSPSSTPTPSPSSTPTPSPSSTPTPSPSPTKGSLPLSVLGDDYLIWYNWNGDPSAWGPVLHYFTDYHCNTARICFTFPDDPGAGNAASCSASTYVYSKMNIVLNELASVGVQAILVDWSNTNGNWYGSQAWVNDWVALATSFKVDARIKGFELCNEPYSSYLASSGPVGAVTEVNSFNAAMAYCIKQIRAVDPTRTIVMPLETMILSGADTWSDVYNSMVTYGIPTKSNILYDVVHPYYFQDSNDLGMTPTQKAQWYMDNFVTPAINSVGASNCWCGETFAFPSHEYIDGNSANGYYSATLQQQFEVAMINHFVAAGMGFQIWCFFTSSNQQDQINDLTNSNYYTLIDS